MTVPAPQQEPQGRRPKDHRCSAPGCTACASFGFGPPIYGKPGRIVWMCEEHRGIVEAEIARANVRLPDPPEPASPPQQGGLF